MNHSSSSPDTAGASRRQFLGAAAGALAVASLAGHAAASSRRPFAPDEMQPGGPIPKGAKRAELKDGQTIKLGVIGMGGPGLGGMGRGHVYRFVQFANIEKKENVEIAAISDVCGHSMKYAQKVIAEQKQPKPADEYKNYKDLLARQDLHGVVIAVPEHWHAQIAIDAITAGKDVYLEKPMTLRLGEALRLREVVRGNPDLRLQVGTQMTNLPRYHEARKLIEAGAIGVPTTTQCSYCRNSPAGEWNYYQLEPDQKEFPGGKYEPGDMLDWDMWCGPLGKMEFDVKKFARWRRYRQLSTGICGDLLVHEITPMLVALGPAIGWPVRVVAVGSHLVDKDMENHDNVNIAVTFENGHQMVIAGSTCNEVGLEKMIKGSKANIYLGGRHCVLRPERAYAEEVEEKTVECPDIGNDQDMHRLKFLKVIRTREQPDSDVEQGAKVMTIVDLATRSLWEGGAYGFDPKTMTVHKIS